MAFLTKDQILDAEDRKTEDVEVPEWGGTVRVISLSARERDAFEQSCVKFKGKKREENLDNIRARLSALTMVDVNNERLFTDAEAEALGRKSAAALDRVFMAAQRLNGMTDEDVEELAEGFDETPDEPSSSD